jgi:hypothetical protein
LRLPCVDSDAPSLYLGESGARPEAGSSLTLPVV